MAKGAKDEEENNFMWASLLFFDGPKQSEVTVNDR